MDESQSSLRSEWHSDGPLGAKAVEDMEKTLGHAGITATRVPSRLKGRVPTTHRGWAWDTNFSLEPEVAYFGFERPEELAEVLSASHEYFWMWAHRRHGVNSYGGGVVARLGPIVIVPANGVWRRVYEWRLDACSCERSERSVGSNA